MILTSFVVVVVVVGRIGFRECYYLRCGRSESERCRGKAGESSFRYYRDETILMPKDYQYIDSAHKKSINPDTIMLLLPRTSMMRTNSDSSEIYFCISRNCERPCGSGQQHCHRGV